MTHRRRAQAAMQARPVMTLRNRRAGRRAQVRASRRPWWTRQGGRRWPTSRVTKKLHLGAIGRREGCLFLGIMKINLPTIRRRGTIIENCLPLRGRSGGILLGVNSSVLDLSIIVEGKFFIKLIHLRNKNDDFKWILMAVYGLAQIGFKSTFLSELVRTSQQNLLPTLIGGDFNIMRHSK